MPKQAAAPIGGALGVSSLEDIFVTITRKGDDKAGLG
jgi:hypothetical protein